MKLAREPRIRAPELLPEGWAAGTPQPLESLRGRVVLVDFFSFADPAGLSELPYVHLIHDHYRNHGLAVLGVHVPAYEFERPAEVARQEIWRLGIPYPVALDGTLVVFRAWDARDLPARYVVDSSGFVRGWHHGSGGLVEAERAARELIREAAPARDLPPIVESPPGLPRPGDLEWMATPEIRFGARRAGFGGPDPGAKTDDPEDAHTFGELPELRAPGQAYFEGRWTLGPDGVTSTGEGRVAVVFEGASVAAVLSTPEGPAGLFVTLDGEAPTGSAGGRDVVAGAGGEGAFLSLEGGRLYELVSEVDFRLHNLELCVTEAGVCLHLLHFGSCVVPGEA